ncbi:MAG: helix-turn-helix domain-containing protein [Atopostipes suicloacalis]|nr:helix-turn-helix domain-containing protein [Atopostipes suicloacalis]MDN6730963.1 helix-turn-helix domain-containing protein [Atopostipes suicloacalis]
MELEKILKEKRIAHQLSQEELAEKIQVSRQSISNWENGRNTPDLASLILISEAYHISLDELVKGAPQMVEKMDKKMKKGQYFTLLMIFTVLLIALNLFYFVHPSDLSAALLFFGIIAIIFCSALLLVVISLQSMIKGLKKDLFKS